MVTSKAPSRPQTPRDVGVVRTIRYEEASPGTPPLPVTTATAPSTSKQSPIIRPRTAPSRGGHRTSHFSEDVKRDSGFATSPLTQQSFAIANALPPTPSLPSYVTEEERAPVTIMNGASPSKKQSSGRQHNDAEERRPRTSFGRKRSRKETRQSKPRSVSPPNVRRLQSFRGIETDIPTGDLDDLTSENFGFSHRGSILFGGKKMNELFALTANGHPQNIVHQGVKDESGSQQETPQGQIRVSRGTELTNTSDTRLKEREGEKDLAHAGETSMIPQIITTEHDLSRDEGQGDLSLEKDVGLEDNAVSPPTKGLVAGRRKPSVQMLQAAIEGGRVLSAEEITFSMKVRSMYEAGDEAAADWSLPNGRLGADTPETLDNSSTDQVGDLSVNKSRGHAKNAVSRRSQDIRASYYTKNVNELAGGIEDWQDVNGGDVDRYGFITPRVNGERPPSSIGADGLQRVATGLRLAADQPRRRGLRRSPSNARSSKSLPPRAPLRPSSLHSSVSAAGSVRSRRSVFRTKDKRITDAAGDMLTLPPGLADIAEDNDDGQAASLLKRREWARNEKWQKMARPMGDSVKSGGAGMRFTFDTTDPKVISRTWKGIPDRWRATAWHSFLSASARRRGKYASDESLVEEFHRLQDVNCAEDYQIDVDVPRTISMHVMFRRRYRGGQRLLFRVLHAISLYFPDTGYVQGMASLAATLLCYFDEERAFVMMVRMWQLRGLEQLFQPGFGGLMAALKELEDNWLAGSDVAQKLNELSITSTAYGTRWYLTLFNMSIPFPAQLRVWDVFMLIGDASPLGSGAFGGADLDVLHATSAALIDATREIILDSDFENTMKVLTSFVPIRDEDLLMRVTRTEWKMAKKRKGIAVM